MQATDTLSSDHRLIERAIAALETAADRLDSGNAVAPELFRDVVRFIQGYADGTHHRKEEGVLFPAMAAQGVPTHGGPIAVMLYEHEQGRAFTAGMRDALDRLPLDAGAADDLVASARGYAALLRQHIFKEDNILFPMAGRVLPADAQEAVMDAFEAVDRERPAGETRADYVELVDSLQARLTTAQSVPG